MNILFCGDRNISDGVLITTLSSVAGMSPMVFSRGEGAAMWRPMGATVAGGLLFAMFVTLVLVPVLYSLAHRGRDGKQAVERAA